MFDHKMFEGFGSRMENLLLSLPIYQLSQAKDSRFSKLNLVELGFATLIFLLETMLGSKKRATPNDIVLFLQKTVQDIYKIPYTQQEAEELKKYLVDNKLRNNGRKYRIPYTDYETGEQKDMLIDLIEYDNYSIRMNKDGKTYLKLSNQGIEVLFKTKEMYQEMQISITMLYFKQQLEKGSYSEALNSVNDLSIQIQQQIKSFQSKAGKLQSNVLSEFNYQKLKSELETSRERTEEEKEQLAGLKLQVTSVKEKYQIQTLTKKQQKKMNMIEEIDRTLRHCSTLHERLFSQKKQMLSTLKSALELMIENLFGKTFHFEKEVIDNWYENQMNQDKLSSILVPMMPMKRHKIYNPMEAFAPQRIKKKREDNVEKIIELDEETIRREQEEEERRKKEKEKVNMRLMKLIFKPLLDYDAYQISDALKILQENDFQFYSELQDDVLDEFLKLCVKIHRGNYFIFQRVSLDELIDVSEVVGLLVKLTHQMEELEDIGEFVIEETGDVLEFPSGERITDYKIKRKERDLEDVI